MALTRITKGVIKPNENYDTHNINSTGIVTAIGLDVNGNGDISGNLSVGGVLTYEDVTSIDSVGIITAQKDIHVGAGISVVGVGSFGSLDISGDLDVDGHTNLDNVSIAGVTTFSGNIGGTATFQDIDVDGHTNLDNVSVAGVSTFSGNVTIDAGANTTLDVVADSAGVAMVRATGASNDQTTAAFELVQSTTSVQGGGISYNGDGSPSFVNGETADHTTFYRMMSGTRYEVFSYPYNSNTVTFNGDLYGQRFHGPVTGNLTGTVVTAAQGNITSLGTLTALSVSGTTSPINFTHTGGNCVTFNRNSKQLAINANYAGNDAYANIVMSSGMDIRWSLGGADRIVFKSDGHIEPQNDSQINLGANLKRFANVYADNFVGALPISNDGNNRVLTSSGSGVVNAEANLVFDGSSLGIGEATPSQRLQVGGNSGDACLSLMRTNAASDNNAWGHVFFENSSDATLASISARRESAADDAYLAFSTQSSGNSNTEKLRITSSGKVLIGNGTTYTPQGMLHIVGDDNSNGPELYLMVPNNNTTDNIGALVFGNNVDKSIVKIQGVTHTANNTGDLTFHTSTTGTMSEKLRLFSSGNLGVGDYSSTSLTHAIQALRTSGTTVVSAKNTNGNATFYAEASNGNTAKLEVFQAGTSGYSLRTGSTDALQFFRDSTYLAQFDSSGRLLIGDSATTNAHANGDDLIIGNTSSGKRTGLTLVSATDQDGQILFSRGTASSNNNIKGQLVYIHADGNAASADSFNIYTNAQHRFRIDQNGDVFIGTTSDIAPTNGKNLCVSDGTVARLVLEKQSTRKFSIGVQDFINIYDETAGSERMRITDEGAAQFTGNDTGTINHQFYNSNSGSGADTRLLIKTYANQNADPYIKFDSGGSNHVVGQLYGGTTNNKLVLGVGESPSGGVSGIHIAGDGNTQVTNDISMTKSSDPRIYSGTSVGLNIDGMALYLNRYVNSTIAMGRGGGDVEVSNTVSGQHSQFNIYKATGSNSDLAILRVGYDGSNCYSIHRQRNSGDIILNQTQGGGKAHHQNTGDDTMILTNRNSVHIAKFAPMVIQHAHVQSSSTWAGSGPYKFVMRFSTGNFSGTYHVARMISQHDWGHTDWEATVYHDYYNPSTSTGSTHRYTGYYGSHTDHVKDYNQHGSGTGTGDPNYLSTNQNLGPNSTFKIHDHNNGGYYRDAYATDYFVNLGTYSGVFIEVKINNPWGFLKDQATTLTDVYPAAFGNSASQTDADNWSYGRGLWFNVRPGILDSSWWGYSSNFGQATLPTS